MGVDLFDRACEKKIVYFIAELARGVMLSAVTFPSGMVSFA